MSKKNKIVYSDIQPNTKEAGVWVNTTDGNVKIEKDGKWVDDGGSSSGDVEANAEYYRIDWDKANELGYNNGETGYESPTFGINSSISCSQECKMLLGSDVSIGTTATAAFMGVFTWITEVKFYKSKFYTSDNGWDEPKSFKDMINSKFHDMFIPITKEEFYAV